MYDIPRNRTLEIEFEVEDDLGERSCQTFDTEAEARKFVAERIAAFQKANRSHFYTRSAEVNLGQWEWEVGAPGPTGLRDIAKIYLYKWTYLVDDAFGGRERVENGVYAE